MPDYYTLHHDLKKEKHFKFRWPYRRMQLGKLSTNHLKLLSAGPLHQMQMLCHKMVHSSLLNRDKMPYNQKCSEVCHCRNKYFLSLTQDIFHKFLERMWFKHSTKLPFSSYHEKSCLVYSRLDNLGRSRYLASVNIFSQM